MLAPIIQDFLLLDSLTKNQAPGDGWLPEPWACFAEWNVSPDVEVYPALNSDCDQVFSLFAPCLLDSLPEHVDSVIPELPRCYFH